MNIITRSFPTAAMASAANGQVAALSARAAKKGIATDLRSTVTQEVDEDGHNRYILTVTFSDLVRLPGGWQLIAVADATATEEPMIFNFDDEARISGTVDMMRCDHCERRTTRTKVMFIESEAGEVKQVGGSCAKDFLGHDPFWATVLFEALEVQPEFSGRIEYPTEIVIAAAIEANRIGYRKVDCEGVSTKQIVEAMLNGRYYELAKWEDIRNLVEASPAATITVQQVLDWMLEQDGEMGANLRRIAESKNIGEKSFGFAAYAPHGADSHRIRVAEMEARRKAEEAAREGASPCPTGKFAIEGTVTLLRWVSNEYGDTLKMRVLTGEGYSVYGTVPRIIEDDIERGSLVRFCANVTPSDDDELFGFYKRPTKAEIIERVEVAS